MSERVEKYRRIIFTRFSTMLKPIPLLAPVINQEGMVRF